MAGLSNTFPLPGVGEMGDVVKCLFNLVKYLTQATGYEKDQYNSLTRRFDSLITVADTYKEHEGFAEIPSRLQEMKTRFEKKLKHKSRVSRNFQAQDRLEVCEGLSRELTDLVEELQFQPSISASMKWMDNFTTIDAFKLLFDEQDPFIGTSGPWAPIYEAGMIKYHGALRVMYKSFRSHSDHKAKTKAAEKELKLLSRIKYGPQDWARQDISLRYPSGLRHIG
ncbi:hypothetical protein BDV93DRAFT_557860 [Ceratobasidium sp. AG-I]|nr:hypothetical protein BDV93DRAFT_557860 [Ceratobasidium sp. AG-I]